MGRSTSVHTVGANSPQKDKFGKLWAFQSWSDGGELNHAYTVASLNHPASLTAKFIPAAGVSILTLPVGLKIKVDGQYNVLNPYYFAWGIGETTPPGSAGATDRRAGTCMAVQFVVERREGNAGHRCAGRTQSRTVCG